MVTQVVPFGLFVVGRGVIHFCEFKAAKAPPSFWNSIPALKAMELGLTVAAVGAFFIFLLTGGHVLPLIGIAVLAVLADMLIRGLCFYIGAKELCQSTGRARRCTNQCRPRQCAIAVNFGRCDAAAHLLKRTGHFSDRRSRFAGKRKPRYTKVETSNIW